MSGAGGGIQEQSFQVLGRVVYLTAAFSCKLELLLIRIGVVGHFLILLQGLFSIAVQVIIILSRKKGIFAVFGGK
jgi:hypothetical protein